MKSSDITYLNFGKAFGALMKPQKSLRMCWIDYNAEREVQGHKDCVKILRPKEKSENSKTQDKT